MGLTGGCGKVSYVDNTREGNTDYKLNGKIKFLTSYKQHILDRLHQPERNHVDVHAVSLPGS